jgi:hypothetical protein
MKHSKPLLIVLLLMFAGTLLLSRYVFAQPARVAETKRKWEYCNLYRATLGGGANRWVAKFVTGGTSAGRLEEMDTNYSSVGALNKLGADGWELVAVIPAPERAPEYILKRPKP